MQHIEDLPLADFIKAVRNIGNMHASEKLDGASLWMGIDAEGRLFTNRSGKRKGSSNFYSEEDYPRFAAYNGFRAAHAALDAKIEDIKRVVQSGQTVEIEVLYGRQPNAVTYGADNKSYIAFLRGVEGTDDVIADQLTTTLGGQTVKVNVEIIDTSDGENLEMSNTEITYQFTGAQRIPVEKLKDVNLEPHIKALEKFLASPAGVKGSELTNGDLISTSLGSVPKDLRAEAKIKKSEALAKVMTGFKLPIKKELLDNYVRKIKPALSAQDILPDEDVGVEGVVLRDPTTGNMIKLVDKDAFTTINAFNHAIRNQISNVVKTFDPAASLDARGGIIGVMKVAIADLLGNAELARGATAKKAFAAVKGNDAIQAVKNLTKNLDISDFLGTKRKILALVQQADRDLKALLDDFKANKDDFQLKLKNGNVIGISSEIEKRTFLVFAESRRNIRELFDKIKIAKTIAQIIATLYGHHAKAVMDKEDSGNEVKEIQEGFQTLLEKKYHTDKARYAGKDAWTLMNIYFANVFMAVIFYQSQDLRGIRDLKDRAHYRMTSWNKEMSQLNFWGYIIWKSSSPAVKKLIGPKAAGQLFKVSRRVPVSNPRYLHMDLSFGKIAPMEWKNHYKTLRLLQQFDGMNVDRINTLMNGVFNYETLTYDQRVKTLAKLYYYIVQFIPSSPLFVRFKAVQNRLILNANGENDEMIKEMKLLNDINSLSENEEGADSTPDISSTSATSSATVARDIAPKDTRLGDIRRRRPIVKRKRNPNVGRAKFPKPNDNKSNKENDESS